MGSHPGRLPPPPLQLPTLPTQADKQKEQNKILTKQLKHMIEKVGMSKNCFENFHVSTIQMIIFASALVSDEIPDKLIKSCKCIINSKTWPLLNKSSTTNSRITV